MYLDLNSTLVGPLSTGTFGGVFDQDESLIEFRSVHDSLWQSRGIYHENDVDNLQAKGDAYYVPLLQKIGAPDPRSDYPDQWTFYPIYLGNTPRTVSSFYGLVNANCSRWGNTTYHRIQRGYKILDSNKIQIVEVIAERDSTPAKVVQITDWIYTINTLGSTSANVSKQVRSKVNTLPGWLTGVDWSVKQTFDTIFNQLSLVTESWEYASSSSTVLAYKDQQAYSTTVEFAKEALDSFVKQSFIGKEFPILGRHEGDLAQEASQKFNANQVNMIAFIRDLRDPKALIPKLKNLDNVKGWADNYLTVKYGILPTVDDIKSIISAVKGAKPYFDRNGFRTYSAGYAADQDVVDIHYRLEQHVKLAISDNESTLEDLVNRIESFGFLPTFENIWDLVPYSFVIDWLIDVGGFLETVDTRLRLARYNVKYATISRKEISRRAIIPAPVCPYTGTIELVHYHRWTTGRCPVPPLSLDTTFQDFDHWLESGALLVQRMK